MKGIQVYKKFWTYLLLSIGILIGSNLFSLEVPVFFLEHAREKKQIEWGLMQRRFLEPNHGMLFHYSRPEKINFWSFNCFIDLSVAFIDENKLVTEIMPLFSFPNRMKTTNPILSHKDLESFPKLDPIILFFQEKSITSSLPAKYVLEMNYGWFEKNQIKVGDRLHWNDKNNQAFFTRPYNK